MVGGHYTAAIRRQSAWGHVTVPCLGHAARDGDLGHPEAVGGLDDFVGTRVGGAGGRGVARGVAGRSSSRVGSTLRRGTATPSVRDGGDRRSVSTTLRCRDSR